ncbi:MAG: protein phosphatase 2C domain-containing protein [Prevotellaceae bacterium]|jgi:serine/threonine protein phosphatase PrpC|nr:protein phosphatase 2C domain-containing protein [Prevotellaceae bacterium]
MKKISIRQPLCYSEQGERENQEDSFYPADPTPDSRVFIVCDGMGGHAKGEVASRTVCDALGSYFEKHPLPDKIRTDEEMEYAINTAIDAAYDALDAADSGEEVKKMGTTLTLVCLHRAGCTVAHIGDSRIYQVRPAAEYKLLYQSSDHSLVNDLVRIGELTPEEARIDPRRNILTRAMQPHQERRKYAEVHLLKDVQAGDYFFLCSDGVLEQLTTEKLLEILSEKATDKEKLEKLKAVCLGKTRDNHTAYLIPIEQVEGEDDDDTANVGEEVQDDEPVQIIGVENPAPQKRSIWQRIFKFKRSAP